MVYLIADITKKPKAFKLGVITVAIVCGFITLLDTSLQISPDLFFKMS